MAPAQVENSGFVALSSSRSRCYPGLECNGAAKGINRPERSENRGPALRAFKNLSPRKNPVPRRK